MLLLALLFVSYALTNSAAMAAVKSAMQRFSAGAKRAAIGWLAMGGVTYAIALGALALLLRRGEASTIFPIAVGCTVVATNALGAVFYGEHLTLRKFISMGLITLGVALTFAGGVHA